MAATRTIIATAIDDTVHGQRCDVCRDYARVLSSRSEGFSSSTGGPTAAERDGDHGAERSDAPALPAPERRDAPDDGHARLSSQRAAGPGRAARAGTGTGSKLGPSQVVGGTAPTSTTSGEHRPTQRRPGRSARPLPLDSGASAPAIAFAPAIIATTTTTPTRATAWPSSTSLGGVEPAHDRCAFVVAADDSTWVGTDDAG